MPGVAEWPRLQKGMPALPERLMQAYPALLEWDGVGSIPANSDARHVPSFDRWQIEA
jgi:hypothetical protein